MVFGITAASLVLLVAMGLVSFAAQKGDPKVGKAKFDATCASCHGTIGKGDGPAEFALFPKPQDQTDGKRMNTLADEYLFDVIKRSGACQQE